MNVREEYRFSGNPAVQTAAIQTSSQTEIRPHFWLSLSNLAKVYVCIYYIYACTCTHTCSSICIMCCEKWKSWWTEIAVQEPTVFVDAFPTAAVACIPSGSFCFGWLRCVYRCSLFLLFLRRYFAATIYSGALRDRPCSSTTHRRQKKAIQYLLRNIQKVKAANSSEFFFKSLNMYYYTEILPQCRFSK